MGRLEDFAAKIFDFQVNLVVLHYLLYAQNKPLANKWVSEKDLPGGSLFFTASHTLPTALLGGVFDGRMSLLEGAARKMRAKR